MRSKLLQCIALGFLFLQLGIAHADDDKVRIAFIAPLSGTFALVFEENLKLFRAAADDINTRGRRARREEDRDRGPAGESWMRAEDHQLMAPIYVTSFVKSGQRP